MTVQTFEFSGEVKLTYDENSSEFQAALASYRELIDEDDATADSMLKHVAGNLSDWGDHQRMIEGVGYVKLEDAPAPKDNFSGITVAPNYDERYFD